MAIVVIVWRQSLESVSRSSEHSSPPAGYHHASKTADEVDVDSQHDEWSDMTMALLRHVKSLVGYSLFHRSRTNFNKIDRRCTNLARPATGQTNMIAARDSKQEAYVSRRQNTQRDNKQHPPRLKIETRMKRTHGVVASWLTLHALLHWADVDGTCTFDTAVTRRSPRRDRTQPSPVPVPNPGTSRGSSSSWPILVQSIVRANNIIISTGFSTAYALARSGSHVQCTCRHYLVTIPGLLVA
ncbi:hypothetical protein HBI56_224950 [Parastagonospora nodorum]|nr:hypothetical protein HBI10_192670 [Parastagonospora nodorum]KAH4008602.1 hypothetical protein HBI13_233220 [Parastagonospora nodorum]KAH4013393.1 hypothetical protein HBI09_217560 [Parastagonospora nodorum]KAH4045198.1 hypothetical protein HBH49_207030 [Parastagonospora nodorum]KAH4084952.1 hypothetical protein HBH46_210600 [Parastagonospora nodorum]